MYTLEQLWGKVWPFCHRGIKANILRPYCAHLLAKTAIMVFNSFHCSIILHCGYWMICNHLHWQITTPILFIYFYLDFIKVGLWVCYRLNMSRLRWRTFLAWGLYSISAWTCQICLISYWYVWLKDVMLSSGLWHWTCFIIKKEWDRWPTVHGGWSIRGKYMQSTGLQISLNCVSWPC